MGFRAYFFNQRKYTPRRQGLSGPIQQVLQFRQEVRDDEAETATPTAAPYAMAVNGPPKGCFAVRSESKYSAEAARLEIPRPL